MSHVYLLNAWHWAVSTMHDLWLCAEVSNPKASVRLVSALEDKMDNLAAVQVCLRASARVPSVWHCSTGAPWHSWPLALHHPCIGHCHCSTLAFLK